MTRIKICGLTRPEDAALAAELGAWALGVIFAAESPRCVSIAQAREIFEAGMAAVSGAEAPLRVGVFVNARVGEIEEAVRASHLDAVQLHGEESPEFCAEVRERLGVAVIKAVRVSGPEAVAGVVRFDTDFVLLDTYHPERRGGTGEAFDWSLAASLPEAVREQRLVLSGGLNPENLAAAVQAAKPFAVDVASGVESAPGIKDPDKLRQLFENVSRR